jgi:hypothetical protein
VARFIILNPSSMGYSFSDPSLPQAAGVSWEPFAKCLYPGDPVYTTPSCGPRSANVENSAKGLEAMKENELYLLR